MLIGLYATVPALTTSALTSTIAYHAKQQQPDPLNLIYRVELRKTVSVKNAQTGETKRVTRVKCGTGFRVKGVQGIVTCLHVVVLAHDGWTLTVVGQGKARQLLSRGKTPKIVRADKAYDLAIISNDEIDKWPLTEGFQSTLTDGKTGRIETFGCPEGIDAVQIDGVVESIRPALGMVPPGNRISLGQRASPDLDKDLIQIKATSGSWSRGSSGSPVLQGGKLIGVVDGGISVGSIGWAIPYQAVAFADNPDNLKGLAKDETQNLFTTAEYEINAEEEETVEEVIVTIRKFFSLSDNRFEKLKGRVYGTPGDYWERYVSNETILGDSDTLVQYGKGGECYVSGSKHVTGVDSEDARYKLEKLVELLKIAIQRYCTEEPAESGWVLRYDKSTPQESEFRQIVFDGKGRTLTLDAIQDDQKRCYVYLSIGIK